MNLLLDTHIIIWAVSAPKKLSKKTQEYISDAETIIMSSVTEGDAGPHPSPGQGGGWGLQ